MKIMPACFVVVGDTVEEARAKRAKLDSLVYYDNAIASLSIALGHDASRFDPDKPLPKDIPESNASKSARQRVVEMAEREKLTVRQLAQRLGGYSGLAMVGTREIDRRRDGGMAPHRGQRRLHHHVPVSARRPRRILPNSVVPELQRRGSIPARIRRQDVARKSRLAAADKPLFRNAQGRRVIGSFNRGFLAERSYARVSFDRTRSFNLDGRLRSRSDS